MKQILLQEALLVIRHCAIAAAVALTIALPTLADDNSMPDIYEQAIDQMDIASDQAETVIRAHQEHWLARIDLMLFLHSFKDPSPERDAEIEALNKLIGEEAWSRIAPDHYARMAGPYTPYDGSSGSLMATTRIASLSSLVTPEHIAVYLIPCAIIARKVEFLETTGAMFGGPLDGYLPRSGCDRGRGSIKGFPDEIIERFKNLTDQADVVYLRPENRGSSIRMSTRQSYVIEQIRMKQFEFYGENYDPKSISTPYKSWGYLSLYNNNLEEKIKNAYINAIEAIAKYINVPPEKSADGISSALNNIAIGRCGYPGGNSLREMLLDGASEADIKGKLSSITDSSEVESFVISHCAAEAGIDPIMHIAVARPDVLPLIAAHPIVGGVDTRNAIGKTPLMTAAHFDLLPAITWLLANNADLTAKTEATESEWYIKHGERTALHYAAANASLAVIEALLNAGADPTAKDDEGLTALDYLTGTGRIAGNTLLVGTDRERAAELLKGAR